MSKKDIWEPCPRCGSNRVRTDSIGVLFLLFGIPLMILGLPLVLIPFIGIPFLTIGLLLTLYGITKKRKNKNLLRCIDCHNAWEHQLEISKHI